MTGKGKGHGKGPKFGSCWNFGGPHYAAQCPHSGKGGSGVMCEHDQGPMQQPQQGQQIRRLSSLREACKQEKNDPDPSSQTTTNVDREGFTRAHGRGTVKLRKVESIMKPRGRKAVRNKYAALRRPDDDDDQAETEEADKRSETVDRKERLGQENEGWNWQIRVNKQTDKKNMMDRKRGKLKALKTIEPEGIRKVNADEWEEIELGVDSGATETVLGEEDLDHVKLEDGIAKKRGVEYEVANGMRVPNIGERRFIGYSEEGMGSEITAQVCDVNMPLLAVRRVVSQGNRVVFDSEGSYIQDKATGALNWLEERNGMYILKLWVKRGGGEHMGPF